MDDETSPSIISIIVDVIISQMKRVTDLLHLAALEAQLTLKTLAILAVLIYLLGSVITVCWLCLLALLFLYLLSIPIRVLSACAIIVGINLAVLACLLGMMYRLKKRLLFPATRRQLLSRRKS